MGERLKSALNHEPLKAAKHLFHLVIAFIFMLLVADIRPDYSFIKLDRRNKIPSSPENLTSKTLYSTPKRLAIVIALFPLMYPITFDTAYFGGILMHMCT